jgi:hypothetical protein
VSENSTNFAELLGDLNAGVFLQQIDRAFSDVSLGTVTNGDKGKKGKVVLTFSFARIGESNQVALAHTIEYQQPTKRGRKSETATTETPLHVGRGGRLTLMPDNQMGLELDGGKSKS